MDVKAACQFHVVGLMDSIQYYAPLHAPDIHRADRFKTFIEEIVFTHGSSICPMPPPCNLVFHLCRDKELHLAVRHATEVLLACWTNEQIYICVRVLAQFLHNVLFGIFVI